MIPKNKKALIIVRCGNKSLHENWVQNDVNYDIVLLPYESVDFISKQNTTLMKTSKGQKWKSVYNYIVSNIDFICEYSHVWIPDDDLEANAEILSEFFTAAQREDVKLAQPSLTLDSYYSHLITLSFPYSYSRAVSFVEVMAPLFSREALLDCLWTFNLNESGWGLEDLWYKILSNKTNFKNNQIIIYDCFSVKHTRPVGGQNRGLDKNSNSPTKEKIQIQSDWRLLENRTIFSIQYQHKNCSLSTDSKGDAKYFCKLIDKNVKKMSEKLPVTIRWRRSAAGGIKLSKVLTLYVITKKCIHNLKDTNNKAKLFLDKIMGEIF